MIDPKSRGFASLAALPHLLAAPAADVPSAVALLNRLIAEMDRRDGRGISSPCIVIAVDEVVDLLMTGGKAVETALTRIAQRGREAGLHLLLGAQKPASSVLGPHLKANLPVRLVGRVGSVEDARVAWGAWAVSKMRAWQRAFPAVARRSSPGAAISWPSPGDAPRTFKPPTSPPPI